MTQTATDRLNNRMDQDNGSMGNEQDITPLAVISRAEIDQQISTAKRYPRSITRAKQKMIEMATTDPETAQGCFYTLKRSGADGRDAFIEGPSVRLAEIAVNAWGNIRGGARIIGEEGNFVVAQGVCHDLEANTFTSIEVRRRIVGRNGRRYSDDMIGVTANAACAIAFRNAVYKVIPKVYINPAFEAARKLVAGDIRSIGQARQEAINTFSKIHVSLEQLMAFLDKPTMGVDDISQDDLVKLRGAFTAIRDGDTTVDEQFPKIEKSKPNISTAADLNEKLKQNAPDASRADASPSSDRGPARSDSQVDPTQELEDRPVGENPAPPPAESGKAPATNPDENPSAAAGGVSIPEDDYASWPKTIEAARRSAPASCDFDGAMNKHKLAVDVSSAKRSATLARRLLLEAIRDERFSWSTGKIS